MARRAAAARSPRHSLAASLRHLEKRLPAEVCHEVRRLAEAQLPEPRPALSLVSRERSWLGIDEAAAVLGISPRTLLQRLKYPQMRRLYGWPFWDGSGWHFAPAALDPNTAASFRATLPELEPFGNLPVWCSRDA